MIANLISGDNRHTLSQGNAVGDDTINNDQIRDVLHWIIGLFKLAYITRVRGALKTRRIIACIRAGMGEKPQWILAAQSSPLRAVRVGEGATSVLHYTLHTYFIKRYKCSALCTTSAPLYPAAAEEDSNSALFTFKKNAVRWLLFFLNAFASSLLESCRLRENVG